MPTNRVTMRRIREALRLHLQAGLSYNEVGLAEVNSVAAGRIGGMHDDRLQDAALADVPCEVVDLLFGKLGTRIVGILIKQKDRHLQRSAVGCAGGRRLPRRHRRGRRQFARMRGWRCSVGQAVRPRRFIEQRS
jgi:hypothetical protein